MNARDRMLDLARRALANAHAPYSKFRVGACVRAASDRLYAGCNVENAAYPVGQCAEATAIGTMVAAGDRKIVEVVIVSEGPEPCAPVHLCGPQGVRITTTLGALLPLAFRPDSLPPT